ncbi:hypothetical protein Aeqsu_1437 [Aequorivita sublithincola DSM 14238]|uniref:Uncharacterized protein n=1 Tax=Aequorivita sublithincola (strain DSM 14238 / LMG 21431 / ACAM 643 / 9-3) TaxID=746697 RepID=I3YVB2_AEQSU|nr:hypothetical protein Aeqsu_1437 [Aequorivita sublithincola DSM 14238]
MKNPFYTQEETGYFQIGTISNKVVFVILTISVVLVLLLNLIQIINFH